MNVASWVLSGLLAAAMFAAGTMKLRLPRLAIIKRGMGWAEDFSDGTVKLIGLAEVLGAIGVVVPRATGIAPQLAPIAAVCLGLLMVGGAAVHVRRKEPPVPPLVLASLAIAIAVLAYA